jgi:hypothetical protein
LKEKNAPVGAPASKGLSGHCRIKTVRKNQKILKNVPNMSLSQKGWLPATRNEMTTSPAFDGSKLLLL